TLLAKEIGNNAVHLEADIDPDQLPLWYRSMDLFVMPSRYENFSNAILEAMACGVPFLNSNTGGNKLLGNTGGGWLFETNSDSSLTENLRTIIADRSELKSRGKIAHDYVAGRYSWETSAECLEKLIASRRVGLS